MAHVLILGMTESGKTTLARNLAHVYKRSGRGVLVLDPLCDPRWNADYATDDQDRFLEVFWQSKRCYAFLDEGGESVGRYNESMQKCATRGRHWGHSCHFIAQRAMQLAPIVRDQCTHLFLFCSSLRDGKVLAEEWNRPELERCTELKQGEYIHAVKFGDITHHNSRGIEHGTTNRNRRSRTDHHRSSATGQGEKSGDPNPYSNNPNIDGNNDPNISGRRDPSAVK